MAMLPKLKLKALVNFPANVLGGTGIGITKASGNFTVDLDYSEFAFQGSLPTGSNVLVWDPVSNVYTLVPPSATGGISDAPNDSKVYGRKNAAWIDAWASPVLTGNPTAPTPAPGDSDTSIATTAFVGTAIAAIPAGTPPPAPATATPLANGVGAVGVSLKYAREDHVHPAGAAGSGDVSGPAGAVADNIATYNGTTGKIIKDGGVLISSLQPANQAVRYDAAQSLTSAQQTQARQNIFAAPFDALAYNGMQINGSMEVSQEKGTTPTTTAAFYICDGWKQNFSGTMVLQGAQVAAPTIYPGYSTVLVVTMLTAQASLAAGDFAFITQPIEGYRIVRLAWGTASAQPITIGFWSSHHRTGLYSGSVRNNAVNRSYAFTYTQNAADTPQYNAVTIPGDTTGTWTIDNTAGINLTFSLGAGATYTAPSANAWLAGSYQAAPGQINAVAASSDVFRITGVVVLPGIEAPSAARSALIMRPYDQELVTCQRYWRKIGGVIAADIIQQAVATGAGQSFSTTLPLSPPMRSAPSALAVGTWTNVNLTSTNFFPSPTALGWQLNATAAGAVQSFGNVGGITLDIRL